MIIPGDTVNCGGTIRSTGVPGDAGVVMPPSTSAALSLNLTPTYQSFYRFYLPATLRCRGGRGSISTRIKVGSCCTVSPPTGGDRGGGARVYWPLISQCSPNVTWRVLSMWPRLCISQNFFLQNNSLGTEQLVECGSAVGYEYGKYV